MLTPRQKLFALEYPRDLNGTQAAIRAGYSKNCANRQAYTLLKKLEIRAAVDAAIKARADRVNIKADDVLKELSEIALRRITVGLGKRFAPAIRMQSKQKALDQLARHLGQYSAEKCVEAIADLNVRLLKANERATCEVRAATAKTPSNDTAIDRAGGPPQPLPGYCDWIAPEHQPQDSPNIASCDYQSDCST